VFAHGITVTVKRSGGTDRYGNTLPGTTHTVSDCAIAPAGSTESDVDSATVEWDLDLLCGDTEADVNAQDAVLLPGDPSTYQVHGRPRPFTNPFTGWKAGKVARLKGVSG
jgi:hypothetical protein